MAAMPSSKTATPGADETHRLAVRVVTENAWHNLFARNMFIQPADSALEDFQPQFTVLQAPSVAADPASDGNHVRDVHRLEPKATHGDHRRQRLRRPKSKNPYSQ